MVFEEKNVVPDIGASMFSGYNSIYVVDVTRRSITPYVYNNDVSKVMGKFLTVENSYCAICEYFSKKFVLPEEQNEFLIKTSIEEIQKAFRTQNRYRYVFTRRNVIGIPEYVELAVVKASEKDSLHWVATFKNVSSKEEENPESENNDFSGNITADDSIGKRTILVVEDSDVDIAVLQEMLRDKYSIMTAHNAEEGLELLKQNYFKIALVILDASFSDGTGYDFLKDASQDSVVSRIPVIVTTAPNDYENEQKCLELGAVDFVAKPYNYRILRTRIHNVIHLRESAVMLSVVKYDELTGLYTRQSFIHNAEMILRSNPKTVFSVIGIDIENYKLTNAQYGERKCDEFLKFFGAELSRCFASALIGRYSGDQFVLLVEKSEKLTSELINSTISEILIEAPIAHQVAKIGIYDSIDRSVPFISCCESAFLAAKQLGGIFKKNIAFYSDEIRSRIFEQQKILGTMEAALEQGQFRVFYQPKHDCQTGRIAGAEALVRWHNPDYGIMSPGKFVPLFEQNGFITKLDFYVLKKVCEDIREWKSKKQIPVPISFNVSRRDFYESGWLEQALSLVEEYKIDSSFLHFEVTESLYTENSAPIVEQLRKVQSKGYMIEMDDFGSGYSSLGMLADFPIDIIKLDISFVSKIEKNEVMIDAIIQMAHRMQLKTVAEGVETDTQLKVLRSLGCDYIQGYYFSKPLTTQEFSQYLTVCHKDDEGEPVFTLPTSRPVWSALTNELEIKNILFECVNTLSSNDRSYKKINKLLSIVAGFYQADRAYLVEYDRERCVLNTPYEWHNEGFGSQQKQIKDVPLPVMQAFTDKFAVQDAYYISSKSDMDYLREKFAMFFVDSPVESLMAAPLKLDGVVNGFVVVDNPAVHTETVELMHTIATFIMNDLERKRYVTLLEKISYIDSLTGARNRTAYYTDIPILERTFLEGPVGIIFTDVNGLKTRNDTEGHREGDLLILKIADIIKSIFSEKYIYRIGGDEFVIFDFNVTEEEFNQKVEKLKSSWTDKYSAAVGAKWIPYTTCLEKNILDADKAMYLDKSRYYKGLIKDRRRPTGVAEKEIPLIDYLIEKLPGGFFTYKADENEQLVSFNQELVSMFGCSSGEEFRMLTKNSFKGMIHPDDLERVERKIRNQINGSDDTDYVEYRIVCKDGSEKIVMDFGRFVSTPMYGDMYYVFIVEKHQ